MFESVFDVSQWISIRGPGKTICDFPASPFLRRLNSRKKVTFVDGIYKRGRRRGIVQVVSRTERWLKRREVVLQRTLLAGLLPALLVVVIGAQVVRAQEPSTRNEFWPGIDVYIDVKPKLRLYLLEATSKSVEDGELRNAQGFESQIGVHIDYLPNEHIMLRTGYRFGSSLGKTDEPFKEHRLLAEQTVRKLIPGGLLVSDRSREEFRFVNGDFSFRYRNRATIEKGFHLFKQRSITPYVFGEISYDTRYRIWNRNRLAVGVQISLRPGPIRKMLLPKRQVILDLYYMRQNDSRSEIQHVKGIGAVLSLYF